VLLIRVDDGRAVRLRERVRLVSSTTGIRIEHD
jgi:hypothetical protein